MKRYLLDTNAVMDLISKRFGVAERVRAAHAQGSVFGTTTPVIGELYYGARNSQQPELNVSRVRHGISKLIWWTYTHQAAEQFGIVCAELRKKGQLIQQIDIQTAAIALTLGNCTIVTTDSDFDRIPGLTVENWRVR